jgi:hypothetical protein
VKAGNLLNKIPCWEVIDGTMVNQNGICEVGVRLSMRPSLTQTATQLEALERGLQSILRELVPQGQRLRLMVQCRPGGKQLLEGYRGRISKHPALELLGTSRAAMYEELERRDTSIQLP